MECPSCGTPVPPGVKFCKKCGTPVKAKTSAAPAAEGGKCRACGRRNAPGVKYCKSCGAPLSPPPPVRTLPPPKSEERVKPPAKAEPEPPAAGEDDGLQPLGTGRDPVKALPIALTLVGAFILLIGFLQPWAVMKVSGLMGYYEETKLDLFAVLSINNSGGVLFLLLICAVPLYLGLISAGTGCGGALSRYSNTGSAFVGFQAASVFGLLAVALIVAFTRGFTERLILETAKSSEDGWAVTNIVIEMGAAYKFLIVAFIVSGAGAVANALPVINSGERRKIHSFIAASVAGAVIIGILTIVSLWLVQFAVAGLA